MFIQSTGTTIIGLCNLVKDQYTISVSATTSPGAIFTKLASEFSLKCSVVGVNPCSDLVGIHKQGETGFCFRFSLKDETALNQSQTNLKYYNWLYMFSVCQIGLGIELNICLHHIS